jgi:hypothetical protein
MGEVVSLGVQTSLDIPPDKVLQGALDEGMAAAVVIGWDKDDGFYFASSDASVGEVLVLLELAKKRLLVEYED